MVVIGGGITEAAWATRSWPRRAGRAGQASSATGPSGSSPPTLLDDTPASSAPPSSSDETGRPRPGDRARFGEAHVNAGAPPSSRAPARATLHRMALPREHAAGDGPPAAGLLGAHRPGRGAGDGRRLAAVPQPGALLARLQRPGAGPRRRPDGAAARAGQVLRHLQPEPRRVLPGPGGRPEGPGGGRARRRTTPDGRTPAQQLLEISDRVDRARRAGPSELFLERARARRWPRRGIVLLELGRPRRGRPQVPGRGVRGAHLPGAHAAGRRPGPPVPVHLQPVAQPGRHRPRPGHRASAASPG